MTDYTTKGGHIRSLIDGYVIDATTAIIVIERARHNLNYGQQAAPAVAKIRKRLRATKLCRVSVARDRYCRKRKATTPSLKTIIAALFSSLSVNCLLSKNIDERFQVSVRVELAIAIVVLNDRKYYLFVFILEL